MLTLPRRPRPTQGPPGPPALSRRELLVNWGSLSLLKWRLIRGHALPAIAANLLVALDRWALSLQRRERR